MAEPDVQAWSEPALMSIDLRQVAESTLRDSRYSALREVVCDCDDGVLILRGTVATHYLKQVAQQLVGSLHGVDKISNQIEVPSASRPAPRL